jgi:hypothetical protein
MSALLQIFKDLAKNFGLSPLVFYLPFAILTITEIIALNFVLHPNIQEFLQFAPILMVVLYITWYLLAISKYFEKHQLFHGTEVQLIKKSVFYSGLFSFIAIGISIQYINIKNTDLDASLFHVSESNKGLAIASIDYDKTGMTDMTDQAGFQNILTDGFIEPLREVFSLYYEENIPKLVQLPKVLPNNFSASLFNSTDENNYSQWAEEHGYDIAIWGNAKKNDSEQYMLNLDFDVLTEPETIDIKSDDFTLNYSISNYDNDSLVASFDNMVQEISAITLYLDERFDDSERIFESLVESIQREIADFSEENAITEIQRKKFERKRSKLEKNLGIVYFYLGNNYLLSGKNEKAEFAYKEAETLTGANFAQATTDDTELLPDSLNWRDDLANNLSVAFVKNKKFDEAETILENIEAEESDNPILANNLGLLYLEQGIQLYQQEDLGEMTKEISHEVPDVEGVPNPKSVEAPQEGSSIEDFVDDIEEDNGDDDIEEEVKEEEADEEFDKDMTAPSRVIANKHNKKLLKAQKIFDKLEKNLEKKLHSEKSENNVNQEDFAQSIYRNNGILSLLNEDYSEAQSYFEKEVQEIKNQQKQLEENQIKQQQAIMNQQMVMPRRVMQQDDSPQLLENKKQERQEIKQERKNTRLEKNEEEVQKLIHKTKKFLESQSQDPFIHDEEIEELDLEESIEESIEDSINELERRKEDAIPVLNEENKYILEKKAEARFHEAAMKQKEAELKKELEKELEKEKERRREEILKNRERMEAERIKGKNPRELDSLREMDIFRGEKDPFEEKEFIRDEEDFMYEEKREMEEGEPEGMEELRDMEEGEPERIDESRDMKEEDSHNSEDSHQDPAPERRRALDLRR